MRKLLLTSILSLLTITPAIAEQSNITQVNIYENIQKTQPQAKQINPVQKYELGEYSFGFTTPNKKEDNEITTKAEILVPQKTEVKTEKPVSSIVIPNLKGNITPSAAKTEQAIKEIKPVTTDRPITRTVQPVANKLEPQQNIVKQMKQIEAQEKTTKVIEQNKKSLEAAPKTIQQTNDKLEEELTNIENKTDSAIQKELEKYGKSVDKAEEKAKNNIKKDLKEMDNKINKTKSKSEKKIKYDKDKPPVPFKIVPKYYEGGFNSSVERL